MFNRCNIISLMINPSLIASLQSRFFSFLTLPSTNTPLHLLPFIIFHTLPFGTRKGQIRMGGLINPQNKMIKLELICGLILAYTVYICFLIFYYLKKLYTQVVLKLFMQISRYCLSQDTIEGIF